MTQLTQGHEIELYHLVVPLLLVARISQSVYFSFLKELIEETLNWVVAIKSRLTFNAEAVSLVYNDLILLHRFSAFTDLQQLKLHVPSLNTHLNLTNLLYLQRSFSLRECLQIQRAFRSERVQFRLQLIKEYLQTFA